MHIDRHAQPRQMDYSVLKYMRMLITLARGQLLSAFWKAINGDCEPNELKVQLPRMQLLITPACIGAWKSGYHLQ